MAEDAVSADELLRSFRQGPSPAAIRQLLEELRGDLRATLLLTGAQVRAQTPVGIEACRKSNAEFWGRADLAFVNWPEGVKAPPLPPQPVINTVEDDLCSMRALQDWVGEAIDALPASGSARGPGGSPRKRYTEAQQLALNLRKQNPKLKPLDIFETVKREFPGTKPGDVYSAFHRQRTRESRAAKRPRTY